MINKHLQRVNISYQPSFFITKAKHAGIDFDQNNLLFLIFLASAFLLTPDLYMKTKIAEQRLWNSFFSSVLILSCIQVLIFPQFTYHWIKWNFAQFTKDNGYFSEFGNVILFSKKKSKSFLKFIGKQNLS